MASIRDEVWLQERLSSDPWNAPTVAAFLTAPLLTSVREKLANITNPVKLKLLMSFLSVKPKNLAELKSHLESIVEALKAEDVQDEWIETIRTLILAFLNDGWLHVVYQPDQHDVLQTAVDDLKRKLSTIPMTQVFPLEHPYLSVQPRLHEVNVLSANERHCEHGMFTLKNEPRACTDLKKLFENVEAFQQKQLKLNEAKQASRQHPFASSKSSTITPSRHLGVPSKPLVLERPKVSIISDDKEIEEAERDRKEMEAEEKRKREERRKELKPNKKQKKEKERDEKKEEAALARQERKEQKAEAKAQRSKKHNMDLAQPDGAPTNHGLESFSQFIYDPNATPFAFTGDPSGGPPVLSATRQLPTFQAMLGPLYNQFPMATPTSNTPYIPSAAPVATSLPTSAPAVSLAPSGPETAAADDSDEAKIFMKSNQITDDDRTHIREFLDGRANPIDERMKRQIVMNLEQKQDEKGLITEKTILELDYDQKSWRLFRRKTVRPVQQPVE